MLKVLMVVCIVLCAIIVAVIGIGLMNAISNLQDSIDHIFDNKPSDSNTKDHSATIKEGNAYIDDGK